MSAIELLGIAKSYGPEPVLSDLNLRCEAGSRTAILGPSGEGKTTLLRLIAGLELPNAGEVHIGSRQVSGPGWAIPPHERDLAIAFQAPSLWPHMRVRDNIMFGIRGLGPASARAQADECSWPAWAAATRTSCPAAKLSASPWPAPWPPGGASCSWTSR